MTARVTARAHAKINLWLRVFGRDHKGYHAIESLFQLISLSDELVLERTASGIELSGAPAELGDPRHNLCYRAAQQFFQASGVRGGATMSLAKRIPWGAGLGGGSSDAAVTLAGLNRLYDMPLDHDDLMEIGAVLGSDVPFFLTAAPLALGWGRGERLLALPPLPSRPLLVVPPPAPVKTADAYGWIDQDRTPESTGEFAAVLPADALASWDAVRRHSHNDFEPAVAARIPAIGHLLNRLHETDAFMVRLCGSGGAVVALFESERSRDAVWERLGGAEQSIRGETLGAAPALLTAS